MLDYRSEIEGFVQFNSEKIRRSQEASIEPVTYYDDAGYAMRDSAGLSARFLIFYPRVWNRRASQVSPA
ncbi:hypothetical protein BTE77_16295 [Ensifer adhaerens]|nr:hypothetical protein N182_10755 [Sinorhizobium sp. GL2]OKP76378.1 hypothetical protein BTE77_16295 [Ensifer adhaerens]